MAHKNQVKYLSVSDTSAAIEPIRSIRNGGWHTVGTAYIGNQPATLLGH